MQLRSLPHIHLVLLFTLLLILSPSIVLGDDAADRQAIESAAQRWTQAFNERDAAALAALSTEDVLVLDRVSWATAGPAHARDVWLRAASLAGTNTKSVTKEVVVSDDVAWRVATVRYRSSSSEWHTGPSLEIWKRTREGWKLHRQMSALISDLLPRPVPSEPVLDKPAN